MDTYQYYSDERKLVVSFFLLDDPTARTIFTIETVMSIYWSDIYVFVFFGGIKHAHAVTII